MYSMVSSHIPYLTSYALFYVLVGVSYVESNQYAVHGVVTETDIRELGRKNKAKIYIFYWGKWQK